ncbi:GH36-type glycosyl hydrolase domain-containing protein [Cypionkella aquatica]|uniref:GH36-type glycosyl hydrolase domain-containing protein n=1 Tax=Cypionkella aquatica TaxID=1756042 RepID=UPI0024E120CB|nr:glucoamylase family protein [Cypionkella aquatica]
MNTQSDATQSNATHSDSLHSAWADSSPIRAELFGTERLEHHAESLAASQVLSKARVKVPSLSKRLSDNVQVLLDAYRASADVIHAEQAISPAAEWLLDNFHLVELQLRAVTEDLPPGFYRQLPKLAEGHLAGYPRVVSLAWAYVAHTDSLISGPVLRRFVRAYQSVTPLEIGEIWAIAISLRIVLVENMRRLAVQIVDAQALRAQADALVDSVIGHDHATVPLHLAVAQYDSAPLDEIFAAQIARRLRGYDPADTPLHGWLEDRLRRQGGSVEQVVAHALSRQGASNVTMRNIVTSLRVISEIDWADFFEDVSLVDARLRASSNFAAMDFATRNAYRTAIEDLARHSKSDEIAVTDAALQLAAQGQNDRARDPGFGLIGPGRPALEAALRYRPSLARRAFDAVARGGLGSYLAALALVSGLVVWAALAGVGVTGWVLLPLALLAVLPASDTATALVNHLITRIVAPRVLPGMELSDGVPPDMRTLVAVPVLLDNDDAVLAQIEQLEVHHLASIGGAVHYALLSDGPDADTENLPLDARLIALAEDGVAQLNRRYPMQDGPRFLLLHRRRLWNPSEGKWMGWERKRGKLHELNRLLRGAIDTSFVTSQSLVPQDVRYVITLDADTRLPRDTLRGLVGKMAHPLNRPKLDADQQRIVEGHAILQPRVTPALPIGAEGSVYQRVYSSAGGIEPYAAAISEVYQDLFDEGSFTGKGIYEVDAFMAAMEGRVPENTMLSHDLFEGIYARAALASDIEVIEDFPARMDVASKRQHRWVRGDWQLLPWLRQGGLPAVGRWKMVDNLRRSLVAPGALAALFAGWLLPLNMAVIWTLLVVAMLALPRLLGLPHAILPRREGLSPSAHYAALRRDALAALAQIGLNNVFLADQAWLMADAIGRTLYRLQVSRAHLLEWVTAAQSAAGRRPGVLGQYRGMIGGVLLGLALTGLAWVINPDVAPLLAVFAAVWALAPLVAWRISRPDAPKRAADLAADDVQALRLIARRTWRFFEGFVTEAENFLPPDNFQEIPKPVVAHRTSPTNIGLYLLSTVAARDMGWISESNTLLRLEQTLATMGRMQRFRGHFYNWYETTDLRVLEPPYVSSVDSGNLAGHLICVAQSCRAWAAQAASDPALWQGLRDTVQLARIAAQDGQRPTPALDKLEAAIARESLSDLADLAQAAHVENLALADAAFWTAAIVQRIGDASAAERPVERLLAIATSADRFANEMDFAFLLTPEKELLSIGFSVASNALDINCYDLLASEARLASLFAIAKKDVPTKHWFRLGRSATPIGIGSALISWSGSMFEYLMPSLVMRAPEGSILAQTNALIVARQQAYGRAMGIPWGISESAYNARDLEMTYQYSNFGVPGLGLKRGLSENKVIAPYATGLATMVDPQAALENYRALAAIGAEGRYGFYEALDFTPQRVPEDEKVAIVRSFMAHHQGMTITAITNTVRDGILRARFHAVPMVQAVDLLLQERVPRDVAAAPPHAEEVRVGAAETIGTPKVRRFDNPARAAATGHLLSNGSYGVMLTPTGAGYSRWRDLAVTRWQGDPSVDALGSFVYLHDVTNGEDWSAGVQPTGAKAEQHSAVFSEHQATFLCRSDSLSTTTEILISAEDDAEARRVTLTNTSRQPREIDLTSYNELVLAPQAADLAHPAFSKMFVVTDYLPELGVLIATRRPRSQDDAQVWAAHIAVVEGEETAPMQIETDRARFIGRGGDLRAPAMQNAPLSGTTGTVLDPIFSIRRRVMVPAGGTVRVTFWTMVAENPTALLELVDRHRDPSAFERASTLAWTQTQVHLRHLGISNNEAADLQTLAGFVLRADPRLRAPSNRIIAGAGPQSGLWQFGISGDRPIVLMLIDDADDLAQVRQILAAHEYWRAQQLSVDLVVLNERSSSYVQDLQIGIEAAVRTAQSRPRAAGTTQGAIYALRTDLITAEARALLMSVARVVLIASRGDIGQQIDALPARALPTSVLPARTLPAAAPVLAAALPVVAADQAEAEALRDLGTTLEFFNGTGGFAEDGREYVTVLRDGATTPAPWINVVANPSFGFITSAEGSGPVWAENSRENQLTPWSNDAVTDVAGEAVYLRDLDSGALWTPTALPMRGAGSYIARHGFGYSRFSHSAHGIAAEMLRTVPLQDPLRITRLTLRNQSDRSRRLSVTSYAEWVMGPSRAATAAHVTTECDPDTGALMARNPYGMAFPGRVAFADIGADCAGFSCDRSEVLGPSGSMADPAGLRGQELSGWVGAGVDPCAAQQRIITLAPGQSIELRFLLGQAKRIEEARDLIKRYRDADLDALQAEIAAYWAGILGAVQVKTPDRSMDILLNGWLLYQTLACRIWARAGFYQASGAYGFRDQLQDGMALTFSRPEMTREHLLRAAARQFPEGDVQHWWLPHSGQGVRTRISDDRVWLGFGVARYVAISGDAAILDAQVPFLEAPQVPVGKHDDFSQPTVSDQTASLFEHCARGIDQAIAMTGENGIPLIGTGDWNDGMNQVGEDGHGTSVWLGWLLIATVDMLAPLADSRDPARAAKWRAHAKAVRAAIEDQAWDGAWYRRGTFDDGTWFGSVASEECKIDSIAQSWSVLSGAGDPARAAAAMEAVDQHLVRRDPDLVLLFTPPFDHSPHNPGYIKGYPPGLRENGGQYSHAAMWAVLAFARLGQGDKAAELFGLLNPINHARTADAAQLYKAEPYVIAADVYSTAPHEGRAGWSWYTGSAGWMYRAGIEGILGLTRAADTLIFDPCLPAHWPGLTMKLQHDGADVTVEVVNSSGAGRGVAQAEVDGIIAQHSGGAFHLPLRPGALHLRLVLGREGS